MPSDAVLRNQQRATESKYMLHPDGPEELVGDSFFTRRDRDHPDSKRQGSTARAVTLDRTM